MGALAVQFRKYRENLVARNSFYSVLQFILPTLLLLSLTPVLVHRMGTENYGLWMLATSALGLMSIAELGLDVAISKFVAEFAGTRDTDALAVVVSSGLIAHLLLGAGLIVPLYVFAPALAGILKPAETLSVEQIGHVIRIMSLGFIPLLLRSGATAIPVGLQRFEIPVVITVGYQVLSYAGALVVTMLGGSVAQVVGSTVVALWITGLGSLLVAWQLLKPFDLKFQLTHSKAILRRLVSFAAMSGISGIGSRIFGFADRVAVGAVLGLDAVAYYTVIISVPTKILQLSGALTSALMPAVSAWMASGAVQRIRTYFLRTSLVVLVANLVMGGLLILISKPLLELWMGEAFADHSLSSFRILILVYAFISINAPAYHVSNGMGMPHLNAAAAITGGLAMVGLIFWLGPIWGLAGAALANLAYITTFVQTFGVSKYLWPHGSL